MKTFLKLDVGTNRLYLDTPYGDMELVGDALSKQLMIAHWSNEGRYDVNAELVDCEELEKLREKKN